MSRINLIFVVSLVLLAMPALLVGDMLFVHPESYTGELRVQIITAVLALLGGVGAYWIGSSNGSSRKTELMAKSEEDGK